MRKARKLSKPQLILEAPVPRRRGRPRKVTMEEVVSGTVGLAPKPMKIRRPRGPYRTRRQRALEESPEPNFYEQRLQLIREAHSRRRRPGNDLGDPIESEFRELDFEG